MAGTGKRGVLPVVEVVEAEAGRLVGEEEERMARAASAFGSR